MVVWRVMVAVHSQVKTHLKLTVLLLMQGVMLPKILSQRAWQINVKFRCLMLLV
ncbi:Uncharacterised protein [Mycobacteroides abscessus subsp. abscessus]|nr:Uncharacterised protein [Mycobacteroides abscessus subsp. abscessus]